VVEENWFERQVRLSKENVDNWPKWMREASTQRTIKDVKDYKFDTSEYIVLNDGVKRNCKTGMLEIIGEDDGSNES
jgi:hypothetical protein